MSKTLERLTDVLTVLLLVVAAYGFSRPGSAVRSAVVNWWRSYTEPRRIAKLWPRLTQGGGRLDNTTGPVQLVEFADFQCPFCRIDHREVSAFVATHPNIGVVYRNFPLAIHPLADGAARAAICADRQGEFKAFHNYLFETQQWQRDGGWVVVARAVKMPNLSTFERCITSADAVSRVAADRDLGVQLGLSGTPAFVTPNRIIEGVQTEAQLAKALGVKP